MARNDWTEWSTLFFAIPETFMEERVQEYLLKNGLIDAEALTRFSEMSSDTKDRIRKIKRLRNMSPLQRILLIAPEAISPATLGFLETFNVISHADAKSLRLGLRFLGSMSRGGSIDNMGEARKRLERLFGVGMVEDAIATLRAYGAVSAEDAARLRALDALARGGKAAAEDLLKAKQLIDMFALIRNKAVTRNFLNAAKHAGLLNSKTANALAEAIKYAGAQWTVFEGAKKAEGLAARLGYVISGSFSHEAVDFVKATGLLPKKYEKYLKVAVQVSQAYNRRLMEQMTNRRFRVVPGEAPIKTFAKASKLSEGDITRLLAQAAKEASGEARKLGKIRGRQYAVQARALHESIRAMWEGVGYVTIFNESAVAEAAIEASEVLGKVYTRNVSEGVQRMMQYQARASIDSYISRQENKIALSRRVYKNVDLMIGRVDKRISLSILAGKSAEEIARDVKGFIRPDTPGGATYAARRLARTELANAFHQTTIRQTREQPWVQAYKWNRSGSHSHTDICDQYATEEHSSKWGPGIFPKSSVPSKPHPQCMCYLTVVGPSEQQFISNFKRGYYNKYLKEMESSFRVNEPLEHSRLVREAAGASGRLAGQVAISKAFSLLSA
jgi:hypothetical protein